MDQQQAIVSGAGVITGTLLASNNIYIQPVSAAPVRKTISAAEAVYVLRRVEIDLEGLFSAKIEEAESFCEDDPEDDYSAGELNALKVVRNSVRSVLRTMELAVDQSNGL